MHKLIHTYLNLGSYINANGEIESVLNYIDTLPDKKICNSKFKFKNGDIKYKNIYFKYDKNNNNYLFNNLTINIKNKSKTAIVGHIGSGKSTLIKLLMGYYPLNKGEITINNNSIYNTDITSLRSNISYVPQSLSLFNRTLFENITYGSSSTTESDIYKIFDKLKMQDIKKIFKSKMNKKVGKNGNNLSGGQKQIVWLLRAFISNNDIIIIDEPTASLDNINKKNVINIINTLFHDKTVIVITHDTEFMKHIHNIIEFDKGKIIKKYNNF